MWTPQKFVDNQVVSLLSSVLGEYVQLDQDQLQLSLWSGTAELRNISCRPDLIQNMCKNFGISSSKTTSSSLGNSLRVKKGLIDLCKVTVPWASLDSEPLVVEIEGLDLHFVWNLSSDDKNNNSSSSPMTGKSPTTSSSSKQENDEKSREEKESDLAAILAFETARKKALETFTAAFSESKKDDGENSNKSGVAASFLEGLVSIVTKNVRFQARNVTCRVSIVVNNSENENEEEIGVVEMSLHEALSVTTDSSWQPRFVGAKQTTTKTKDSSSKSENKSTTENDDEEEDRFQHRTLSLERFSVRVLSSVKQQQQQQQERAFFQQIFSLPNSTGTLFFRKAHLSPAMTQSDFSFRFLPIRDVFVDVPGTQEFITTLKRSSEKIATTETTAVASSPNSRNMTNTFSSPKNNNNYQLSSSVVFSIPSSSSFSGGRGCVWNTLKVNLRNNYESVRNAKKGIWWENCRKFCVSRKQLIPLLILKHDQQQQKNRNTNTSSSSAETSSSSSQQTLFLTLTQEQETFLFDQLSSLEHYHARFLVALAFAMIRQKYYLPCVSSLSTSRSGQNDGKDSKSENINGSGDQQQAKEEANQQPEQSQQQQQQGWVSWMISPFTGSASSGEDGTEKSSSKLLNNNNILLSNNNKTNHPLTLSQQILAELQDDSVLTDSQVGVSFDVRGFENFVLRIGNGKNNTTTNNISSNSNDNDDVFLVIQSTSLSAYRSSTPTTVAVQHHHHDSSSSFSSSSVQYAIRCDGEFSLSLHHHCQEKISVENRILLIAFENYLVKNPFNNNKKSQQHSSSSSLSAATSGMDNSAQDSNPQNSNNNNKIISAISATFGSVGGISSFELGTVLCKIDLFSSHHHHHQQNQSESVMKTISLLKESFSKLSQNNKTNQHQQQQSSSSSSSNKFSSGLKVSIASINLQGEKVESKEEKSILVFRSGVHNILFYRPKQHKHHHHQQHQRKEVEENSSSSLNTTKTEFSFDQPRFELTRREHIDSVDEDIGVETICSFSLDSKIRYIPQSSATTNDIDIAGSYSLENNSQEQQQQQHIELSPMRLGSNQVTLSVEILGLKQFSNGIKFLSSIMKKLVFSENQQQQQKSQNHSASSSPTTTTICILGKSCSFDVEMSIRGDDTDCLHLKTKLNRALPISHQHQHSHQTSTQQEEEFEEENDHWELFSTKKKSSSSSSAIAISSLHVSLDSIVLMETHGAVFGWRFLESESSSPTENNNKILLVRQNILEFFQPLTLSLTARASPLIDEVSQTMLSLFSLKNNNSNLESQQQQQQKTPSSSSSWKVECHDIVTVNMVWACGTTICRTIVEPHHSFSTAGENQRSNNNNNKLIVSPSFSLEKDAFTKETKITISEIRFDALCPNTSSTVPLFLDSSSAISLSSAASSSSYFSPSSSSSKKFDEHGKLQPVCRSVDLVLGDWLNHQHSTDNTDNNNSQQQQQQATDHPHPQHHVREIAQAVMQTRPVGKIKASTHFHNHNFEPVARVVISSNGDMKYDIKGCRTFYSSSSTNTSANHLEQQLHARILLVEHWQEAFVAMSTSFVDPKNPDTPLQQIWAANRMTNSLFPPSSSQQQQQQVNVVEMNWQNYISRIPFWGEHFNCPSPFPSFSCSSENNNNKIFSPVIYCENISSTTTSNSNSNNISAKKEFTPPNTKTEATLLNFGMITTTTNKINSLFEFSHLEVSVNPFSPKNSSSQNETSSTSSSSFDYSTSLKTIIVKMKGPTNCHFSHGTDISKDLKSLLFAMVANIMWNSSSSNNNKNIQNKKNNNSLPAIIKKSSSSSSSHILSIEQQFPNIVERIRQEHEFYSNNQHLVPNKEISDCWMKIIILNEDVVNVSIPLLQHHHHHHHHHEQQHHEWNSKISQFTFERNFYHSTFGSKTYAKFLRGGVSSTVTWNGGGGARFEFGQNSSFQQSSEIFRNNEENNNENNENIDENDEFNVTFSSSTCFETSNNSTIQLRINSLDALKMMPPPPMLDEEAVKLLALMSLNSSSSSSSSNILIPRNAATMKSKTEFKFHGRLLAQCNIVPNDEATYFVDFSLPQTTQQQNQNDNTNTSQSISGSNNNNNSCLSFISSDISQVRKNLETFRVFTVQSEKMKEITLDPKVNCAGGKLGRLFGGVLSPSVFISLVNGAYFSTKQKTSFESEKKWK